MTRYHSIARGWLVAGWLLTIGCARAVPGPGPAISGPIRTAYALRWVDIVTGKGEVAKAGQHVEVHYTGWLPNGKKFDSSLNRKSPFQFVLGAREVIPGWDGGVEGMRVGGKRRLIIPYQLAYGARGRPPAIPPKSDLTFDVELVGVKRGKTSAAHRAALMMYSSSVKTIECPEDIARRAAASA